MNHVGNRNISRLDLNLNCHVLASGGVFLSSPTLCLGMHADQLDIVCMSCCLFCGKPSEADLSIYTYYLNVLIVHYATLCVLLHGMCDFKVE